MAKKSRRTANDTGAAGEGDGADAEVEAPVNVGNKWNAAKVKTTLDDILRSLAEEELPEHKESHRHTDARITLGGLACAFALVGVSYGYLVPHPESSLVVGICVLAYFLFSSLLTLYIMYYDPMYLFQAKRDDEEIAITTHMERYDHHYTIMLWRKIGNGQAREVKHEGSVTDFIYEDGEVSIDRLKHHLKYLLADARSSSAPASSSKAEKSD